MCVCARARMGVCVCVCVSYPVGVCRGESSEKSAAGCELLSNLLLTAHVPTEKGNFGGGNMEYEECRELRRSQAEYRVITVD